MKIVRGEKTEKETKGTLLFPEGLLKCFTLERNDKMIPAGTYPWRKVGPSAHINHPHIAIDNVPGRSGICIHILNYYSQSLGCIGVGSGFKDLNADNEEDILNSGATLTELLKVLPESGILTIE